MMRISVAVAWAGSHELIEVRLAEGATVADALAAARSSPRWPGVDAHDVGVWGRVVRQETRLREGDRVEIYRPIRADAKAMRRARAGLKGPRRSRSAP